MVVPPGENIQIKVNTVLLEVSHPLCGRRRHGAKYIWCQSEGLMPQPYQITPQYGHNNTIMQI